MATNDKILRVLLRNGTDQPGRTDAALDPDSVRIQGFELEQWMQFAHSFAEKVQYYSTDNPSPVANWQPFFNDTTEAKALIREIAEGGNGSMTPHMTLFVCFLKLMELSTKRMNALTGRHLDFYYEKVLQIERLPATEDKVHILFELARTVSDYLVDEGTELDAGKDATAKKLVYEVGQGLVASKTTVAEIRNVYNEHNIVNEPKRNDENRYYIKASPVADSSDGIGGKLSAADPAWYPFGYYTSANIATAINTELPDKAVLPDARLGCAVASPVLNLSEGKRTITLKFTFTNNITPLAPATPDPESDEEVEDEEADPTAAGSQPVTGIALADLHEALEVWLTGEKKWIGPFELELGEDEDPTKTLTRIEGNELYLTVRLDTDDLPVMNYSQAIHGEHFNTASPVARLFVKTDTAESYQVYSALAGMNNLLQKVEVIVDVKGMKNLVLDSDTGTLNTEKPFYPFTAQPVKGSSFSVYNKEAFGKKWTTISVNMKWKNTPLSFKKQYVAYETTFESSVSVDKYTKMFQGFNFPNADADFSEEQAQFSGLGRDNGITHGDAIAARDYFASGSKYVPIVTGDTYFKIDALVQYKDDWKPKKNDTALFNIRQSDGSFETTVEVTDDTYETGKAGPLKLVLQQSFLHEMYPRLYAVAISSQVTEMLIPNEPYTPFAEDATLDYKAVDSVSVNPGASVEDPEADFEARTMQLFHEHPFGQSEEHAWIKSLGNVATECHVFPTYCKGGELYIGLRNAKPSELVSLLIQVAEGTENPLANTFLPGQKVHWDVLCDNVWRTLDSDLMVTNEIDNFLLSGRVRFTIPPYATDTNTLLPSGLFWIRAKMFKRYDAMCKVLGIHAQAGEARFDNRGNELSHLTSGIPAGTISKLVNRVSQVKTVTQPYASFGGKPEESDDLYYRRVSERLRHKGRAVSLWDYEHLVLQEFPDIYKAKCLNHTCDKHFTTPGSVTVVVIPDTISKTVFDTYQPRVSTAMLNRIQNWLGELNSMHVSLQVVNPRYEEVVVELGAKFYKGYDDNHYKKQLEEDIMKFLSPWAFERTREVAFGVMLYRSTLIHYIEQLNYVDYIEDVKIYKDDVLQPRNCEPSDPRSILVSARRHKINLAVKTCQVNPKQETEEECQL